MRDFLTPWRHRRALLLGLAGAAVILVLVAPDDLIRSRPGPAPPAEGAKRRSFDRFRVHGMDSTHRVAGEEVFRITAREVVHRRKKIGPLTLNPVKEVLMVGVRLEVYRRAPSPRGASGQPAAGGAPQGGADPFGISLQEVLRQALPASELGFIARVSIRDLAIVVLEAGEERLELHAGRATVGLDSGRVVYEGGFSLAGSAGQELSAARAEWQSDRKRFFVPGAYVLRGASGTREGVRAFLEVGPGTEIRTARD